MKTIKKVAITYVNEPDVPVRVRRIRGIGRQFDTPMQFVAHSNRVWSSRRDKSRSEV